MNAGQIVRAVNAGRLSGLLGEVRAPDPFNPGRFIVRLEGKFYPEDREGTVHGHSMAAHELEAID